MDASAYLKKQGWRGDGHSLDHTDRGIKKPLLVSKKVDVLGVGKNKHAPVSDQWWLRAFDQGLKALGTGEESVLASVQKHGVNRGGLYGRFVRGERFEGSIGQTLEEDEMAIDIPPPDKLERVVGNHTDQNSHDAMMYLLQNPDQAPASMKKMLDRKRKRAERPAEKRARRKVEQTQKMKEAAKHKREEAIAKGTFDTEKEMKARELREINRQASGFVLEAQKRGIVPLGPNEIRKGIVPAATGANGVVQPDDALQEILAKVDFDGQEGAKNSTKKSVKRDKYAREKMKREVKRAAKAYLMGEKLPHEQTPQERKAKEAERKTETAKKRAEASRREAERLAMQEAKAVQKQERRAKKAAETAEVSRIMKERDAGGILGVVGDAMESSEEERDIVGSSESGDDTDASEENTTDEFDTAADEVKLGMTRKGRKKKIPGVGAVDRYPSKAEKQATKLKAKAIREGISDEELQARIAAEKQQKLDLEQEKIDRYRAMKQGMGLEEYRAALPNGEILSRAIQKKNLPPEKLAEYRRRAAEKGVKLEDYIRRREEKTAAKSADKLGNPF